MATSARAASAFGRQPDYRTANEAIDSILARAAFDQRKTSLKRAYKSAERDWRAISRREQARGARWEAAAEARNEQVGVVNYRTGQTSAASRHLEALNKRWDEAAKERASEWATQFAASPKYADLRGKERKEAWQAYLQTQARRLPIYRTEIRPQERLIKTLMRQEQASRQALGRQQRLVRRGERGYKQMSARSQKAHDAYEAAVKRFNSFQKYEPYRPA